MNFERRSPFRNRHFRTQALGSRRVRPRHREGATSRRAKSADAKMASLILGTADTPVWLLCSQPDQVSGDCMRGDPPSVQVYGRKFEFAKFQSLQAPDKMQKLFSTLSGRPENIVRVLVLARFFFGRSAGTRLAKRPQCAEIPFEARPAAASHEHTSVHLIHHFTLCRTVSARCAAPNAMRTTRSSPNDRIRTAVLPKLRRHHERNSSYYRC